MIDAPQLRRAVERLFKGTETRPPNYHAIQRHVLLDQRVSKNHWTWNVSADCLNPVYRTMYGRPFKDRAFGPREPQWLEVFARCRECESCLKHRARLWRGRMLGEIRHSVAGGERMWFCTLTSNPNMRTYYEMSAASRLNKTGGINPKAKAAQSATSWWTLPADERFKLIHKEISRDITLWLKRLRTCPVAYWRMNKQAALARFRFELKNEKKARLKLKEWVIHNPQPKQAQFRYLIVCEAHKAEDDPTKKAHGARKATGGIFPHYHILIHEVSGELKSDFINMQWRSRVGFMQRNLVKGDPEDLLYLVKYLAKDNRARVRASNGYGQWPNDTPTGNSGSRDEPGVKKTAPLKEKGDEITPSVTDLNGMEEGLTHGVSDNRLSPGNHAQHRLSRGVAQLSNRPVPPGGSRPPRWARNAHDALWNGYSTPGGAENLNTVEARQIYATGDPETGSAGDGPETVWH